MRRVSTPNQEALLIVGPTGAGKTPLGERLDGNRLAGRRCHHFDFGASLRAVTAGSLGQDFAPADVQFIQEVLEKGALLENETFHIAEKVLQAFIAARKPGPGDLLVLNGLPRHLGQAQALERSLDIVLIVCLECDARTVQDRLRRDSGGDRAGRVDDSLALVRQKLATYQERTKPLVDHYRQRGVKVISVNVTAQTQPDALIELLG